MDKRISSNLPKVTIISPSAGVIPVAYSIREALNAEQIYWATNESGVQQFPKYVTDLSNNPCIIVDDIVRSGSIMNMTFELVKGLGATIIGCGSIVKFQSGPNEIDGVEIQSLMEFDCHSYDTVEEWRKAEGNDSPQETITF